MTHMLLDAANQRLTGVPQPQRIALLVEDEWLIRMEIADALDDAGWIVIEAGSGEEAIALFANGGHADLLITDIRLPGELSGWDLAARLRALEPGLAVIYASANPAVEALQVAGSLFIGKPSRTSALIAACEQLWDSAPHAR